MGCRLVPATQTVWCHTEDNFLVKPEEATLSVFRSSYGKTE